MLLLLLCCLAGLSASRRPTIDSVLNVLGHVGPPISVGWGIPDTYAYSGKLFNFSVPADAFRGNVSYVQVVEYGRLRLPSWMSLDRSLGRLTGIPLGRHVGRTYILQVTAVARLARGLESRASDTFSIHVEHEWPFTEGGHPLRLDGVQRGFPWRCASGSPLTRMCLLLDADLASMDAAGRVSFLLKTCEALNLPTSLPRLVAAEPVSLLPASGNSAALVAGPGDVLRPTYSGVVVEWLVGCGNVYTAHMPTLQKIEAAAPTGELSRLLAVGVVGWHVSNDRIDGGKLPSRPRDRRNFVQPTGTLLPKTLPPSRLPVHTATVTESGGGLTRTVIAPSSPLVAQPSRRSRTESAPAVRASRPRPDVLPTGAFTATRTRDPSPTRTMPPVRPSLSVVTDVTASQRPTTVGWSRSPFTVEPSRTVVPPLYTKATATPPVAAPDLDINTKPPERYDYAPVVQYPLADIVVHFGDVLNFEIPENLFSDVEEGSTRNLSLLFLTSDDMTVAPNSWIRLDTRNQRLYGMPLATHQGSQEYILVAMDSQEQMAKDRFRILVRQQPAADRVNHEFNVAFNLDYDHFMSHVQYRIDMVSSLVRALGEMNTKHVTLLRIDEGSVEVTWYNKSMPSSPCPSEAIGAILDKMIWPNNTLRETFLDSMKSYKVVKAGAVPRKVCLDTLKGRESESPERTDQIKKNTSGDDTLLFTTVLPAAILALLLLLAAIIACLLYRRRRATKMARDDEQTFINKGIPIIFAEELEECPEAASKPLVLEQERPPNPPPNYAHSSLESRASDGAATSLYRPPPPFSAVSSPTTTPRDARSRNNASYRQPPPYVPP